MNEEQRRCAGTMEKQADGSWMCPKCKHRWVPPPKKIKSTKKTKVPGALPKQVCGFNPFF